MFLLTKLRALFRPKQAPAPPAHPVADDEFLEAVAKTWRQRYATPTPRPEAPPSSQEQAA